MREGLRIDGPANARATVVLAHGAGAPMDSPFMETIAAGLAARDLRVVRFEFPYMRRWRVDGKRRPPDREPVLRESWISVVDALGGAGQLVIGGKSMGGRIASLVADDLRPRGLVLLGYPFHPSGRPERLRVEHLAPMRTPTLIVQGERDALGNRAEIAGYELSPRIRVEFLEDGDHSFRPRARSGVTLDHNVERAVEFVSRFVRRRTRD